VEIESEVPTKVAAFFDIYNTIMRQALVYRLRRTEKQKKLRVRKNSKFSCGSSTTFYASNAFSLTSCDVSF